MADTADRAEVALRKLGAELVELWASGGLMARDANTTIRLQDASEAMAAGANRARTWFRPDEETGKNYFVNMEGAILVGMMNGGKATPAMVLGAELIALWKRGAIEPCDAPAADLLKKANDAAQRLVPQTIELLDCMAALGNKK